MPNSAFSARRRLALLALALTASAGATACLNQDLSTPRPARMVVEGGSGQTVAPLERAPTPLTVRVFDQFLSELPGQTVTWRVQSGGGAVSEAASVTNANGIAGTVYTAGGTTGAVYVSATLEGLGTLTITVTVATPAGT